MVWARDYPSAASRSLGYVRSGHETTTPPANLAEARREWSGHDCSVMNLGLSLVVLLGAWTNRVSCRTTTSHIATPFTEKYAVKQPVVIDTDIGSDYDDGVAVAFAISESTYLDVKLIVTCTDDTTARAKVTAKLLTLFGRDDIPIGIGVPNSNKTDHTLFDWAMDFNLSSYKGGVYVDGVEKMAEVITSSESVVDIIAIGPMTNFPLLLSKYPAVVKNARVHAMAGSIYKGYDNSSTPSAEYNVRLCPNCMSELLHAGWDVTITPLDTCGVATLTPPLLEELLTSADAISLGIANSLIYFCISNPYMNCRFKVTTPVLYDAVATLLTLPNAKDFVVFNELKLTISNEGYTVINNKTGVPTQVALYWQHMNDGLNKFRTYLTESLSGG